MPYRESNEDWAQQVPRRSYRGPYEDYGWERRESVLPEFRDPSVHDMPYERSGRWPARRREGRYGRPMARGYERDRYEQEEGPYSRSFDRAYGYGRDRDYQRWGNYSPATNWSYTEVWWIPGPETGRGPRGYEGSDERIQDEVCERLTQHGQIDASDISVSVSNNEVTLTGTVKDRRTKLMAEDVADSVFGVQDVHNRLRIQHFQSEGRTEQESQTSQQGRTGQQRRDSGQPGGGQGRVDRVGQTGVYPASASTMPEGEAEVQGMASWGQGERGAEGYKDHGDSEIWYTEEERREAKKEE